MKIHKGYREATMEERAAFNAARQCAVIRYYGANDQRACGNRSFKAEGGECEYHAHTGAWARTETSVEEEEKNGDTQEDT